MKIPLNSKDEKSLLLKKLINQVKLTTFMLMLCSVSLFAQNKTPISGVIVDVEGEPIMGVNVVEKGSSNGTISDIDGKFSLSATENAIVRISYLGHIPQEITANKDQQDIKITLLEDAHQLEELVVVGYGVQKKETLTGAISVIKTDEILTTSSSSLAQKLQGKVPGLNIRQSTGQPGTFENDIRIRGFEEAPLFVIDGIPRGGSEDFQKLAAEDIESISVLKDASAAIYGMNSDNGVIIVTTKRGAKGKAKFKVNGSWSFSKPTDQARMANASEYALLRQEANLNAGRAPYYSDEDYAYWMSNKGTDWYDEVFKSVAQRGEFNVSAEGGGDKMTYYVNFGALDEGSLLRTDDISYQKYNLRVNLSANLTNNLTANVLVGGYVDQREQPKDGIYEIWRGTISSQPTKEPYANGNPNYINLVRDGQSYSPIASSNSDVFGYYNNKNTKYNASVELAYKAPFLDGLQFKGIFAYDGVHHQSKTVDKKFNMYQYDANSDKYNPMSFGSGRVSNHFNNNANCKSSA